MRDMANALGASLRRLAPDADFAKRAAVFDLCSRRVDRIAESCPDDGARILGLAAFRTFCALEESATPAADDAIDREFLSNAVRSLLDHGVLQPTRDEVMREKHWDNSEQICYERELLSRVGEEGKRLQSAVFAERGARPIRAPRRSVPQKGTTLERLGESLPVLALEEK
jgi:hypothetical protein